MLGQKRDQSLCINLWLNATDLLFEKRFEFVLNFLFIVILLEVVYDGPFNRYTII